MNLIEELISNCLNDARVNEYFSEIFIELQFAYEKAISEGQWLEDEHKQGNFLLQYFAKIKDKTQFNSFYNKRGLIVSLKKKGLVMTFFFHFEKRVFSIIHHMCCLKEKFTDLNVGDIFLLEHIRTKRHYLYNEKGEFLNIEGDEIRFYSDFASYYITFMVVNQNEKLDIYSKKLEQIVSSADSFKVVDEYYGIYSKNGLKYLSQTTKGNILSEGFETFEYIIDRYYVHNDLHFFMLKNSNGYGLFFLKNNTLINNFDWQEYKTQDRFDYLFYKKDDKWFRFEFYKLNSVEANILTFDKRIRI